MTELIVIRHGQANTGATDEANYDRLSDLGKRQAQLLGETLRDVKTDYRVISGAMRRHIETAEHMAMNTDPIPQDARLNELDYFGMAKSVESSHGIDFPQTHEDFATHIPQVLDIWRKNEMADGIEPYDSFRARIFEAVLDAANDGPAILVSSGGVIATLVTIALHLETAAKSKMLLAIPNTSVHKFMLRDGELFLTQFAATPHLDHPERMHLKTHI